MASIYLTLPSNKTPVGTLYPRNSNVQSGSTVTGVASGGRPVQYVFNLGAFADGDYEIDTNDPPGNWKVRIAGASAYAADNWFELDQLTSTDEIAKIPRAAAAVTAGGAVERHIVSGQGIIEIIDGVP